MTTVDRTSSERVLETGTDTYSERSPSGSAALTVCLYVACLALAVIGASALVILSTEASVLDAMAALIAGSIGSLDAFALTLQQSTPILVVALGAIIALRAGVFSIGQDGQFWLGGLAAGVILFKFGLQPVFAIPLALTAAAAGGGAWAGVAAVLHARRGVDLIISTLLLSFVAEQVVSYCVNQTWLLQERVEQVVLPPQSPRVDGQYRFPILGEAGGVSVTTAYLLALVLVVVVTFALNRTPWGFRIKMLGSNIQGARAAGVRPSVIGGGALVLSGAFAGVAGGIWLTAVGQRLVVGFGGTMAAEGLLVALISRRNAYVAVGVAFFFGMLRTGGGFLAATGVPSEIVDVAQALIVLAALLPPALLHVITRQRETRFARRAARSEISFLAEAA